MSIIDGQLQNLGLEHESNTYCIKFRSSGSTGCETEKGPTSCTFSSCKPTSWRVRPSTISLSPSTLLLSAK